MYLNKKLWTRCIAICTGTLLSYGFQVTADAVPMPSVAVRLDLTASDALKTEADPLLTGELRKVEGVALTTSDRAAVLSVIITEQRDTGGGLMGYLAYVGGYQPVSECDQGERTSGEARPVLIQWQTLRMFPPDLAKACERIVAGFRQEVVEPTQRAIIRVSGGKQ